MKENERMLLEDAISTAIDTEREKIKIKRLLALSLLENVILTVVVVILAVG